MAAFQTGKAWCAKNQAVIGTTIGTGFTVGSVGLSWLHIATSNQENVKAFKADIKALKVDVEDLGNKMERYHNENRTERIAGAQDFKSFLQFGLSKEILAQVQDKKDGGKDDQKEG